MSHTDRRAVSNGSAPRKPAADVPKREPMTVGQYMHPDHRHRPVLRGEMFAYGDVLGEAITARLRANRLHRRLWRWVSAWWHYLTTPRGAS